jgi:pimeloyl-ACP methyl ester carboxylesterase
MKNSTQIIHYKNSFIHVELFGNGNKWLFCFHGFGEDGKSFKVLEDVLGGEYILVAIDLPFHGKTTWNEGLLITPDDLLTILDKIVENNSCINLSSKFSFLAFSLGGRIALHLLQLIPSKIERVVLLAPDGLQLNFWYWLGTQTNLGNKLFSYTMKKPKWFFTMMNVAGKMRLLNKSIIKFARYYLDDSRERELLYKRWTTMRKFKPEASLIKNKIDKYDIPVRLLFGKYDRMILTGDSSFFGSNKNVKVMELAAGHQLLKEKFADDIAVLFSQ